MAFPANPRGQRTQSADFGAQWLACAYPCRRFTRDVAAAGARLGAMVARYAFHVGLFHPLLYAGLSRRFRIYRIRATGIVRRDAGPAVPAAIKR